LLVMFFPWPALTIIKKTFLVGNLQVEALNTNFYIHPSLIFTIKLELSRFTGKEGEANFVYNVKHCILLLKTVNFGAKKSFMKSFSTIFFSNSVRKVLGVCTIKLLTVVINAAVV
jgi:hypothetical protein